MAEEVEGATPREQLLECCRRDNIELFHTVISTLSAQPATKTPESLAAYLNSITDSMGNYLLHVCANYGSYDVLDALLDTPHLECDPFTPRDGLTPIHCAVTYALERNVELGGAMAKTLVDAGGDPRVRDKYGRKPADMCKGEEMRGVEEMLRREEYVLTEGLREQEHEDDDEGGEGSASDSE